MNVNKKLISIHPEELKFIFELGKQSFCDVKVTNNIDQNVAFKVKTTSLKKYYVRPNTGILHPWDSCVIRVTLQAQKQYPLDMQCNDKFLLKSTRVFQDSEVDDIPQDAFNKESGKMIEECKLKVVYASPNSTQYNVDENTSKELGRGLNARDNSTPDDKQALQRAKEEKDSVVRQTEQLQQELEQWKKKHQQRRSTSGYSCKFCLFVAMIGIIFGFLLKLSLSSPSTV